LIDKRCSGEFGLELILAVKKTLIFVEDLAHSEMGMICLSIEIDFVRTGSVEVFGFLMVDGREVNVK
jgi:hypothetical protein